MRRISVLCCMIFMHVVTTARPMDGTAAMIQQQTAAVTLDVLYKEARKTRRLLGPHAAQPLYEQILHLNPADITTSTRMGANSKPNSHAWRIFSNFAGTTTMNTTTMVSKLNDDCTIDELQCELRNWFQQEVNYTSKMIGILLKIPRNDIRAPIYITPANSGSTGTSNSGNVAFPFPIEAGTTTTAACQCLVSLFLFGLCIDIQYAIQSCSLRYIDLLRRLGLICHCEYNPNLIYAVVSIMPVDIGYNTTLYVVTDWHPRVLNMIRIPEDANADHDNSNDEAVMYIGPDSLALIEHWIINDNALLINKTATTSNATIRNTSTNKVLLDLCTGSGIQALCYMKLTLPYQKPKQPVAVCVDRNPRALRFAQWNAALNDIPSDSMTFIQGDLLQGTGKIFANEHGIRMNQNKEKHQLLLPLLHKLHPTYDVITANPPFIPVPPPIYSSSNCDNSNNRKTYNDGPFLRHGLFSSGGPSGEKVLAAVLAVSKSLSKPNGGYTAIVSEFFFRDNLYNDRSSTNPNNDDTVRELVQRLQSYWYAPQNDNYESVCRNGSKAILFSNEFPISRQVYANRRADSNGEVQIWQQHMEKEHITSCSPGLLYIQTFYCGNNDCNNTAAQQWIHHTVPKSDLGSIWTPSNTNAIAFTNAKSRDFFRW